jgi:hypothetical protein
MIIELYNADDWVNVKSNLQAICKHHPEFKHDTYRLIKNVEAKVRDLCVIDIELKKNKTSLHYKRKRKKKIYEINHLLKMISNIALIAILAK